MIITDTIVEQPRAQARRRIQQRRCLVCGSRQLANHDTSYFCVRHLTTHRWCFLCETLRTAEDHGNDKGRCRSCSTARATAHYHADPDRTHYRMRLYQLSQRTTNEEDRLFAAIQRQIALAAFVRATPGWTWTRRAQALGVQAKHLALRWRRQQEQHQ